MDIQYYSKTFQSILRQFPELMRYNITFEAYESEHGFSVGQVRRRDNSFIVRLATNLVKDEVHTSFVIAHELAHMLVNSRNVPVEGRKWKPKNDTEKLDQSIEDMVCDWIALKRLEHYYKGDKEKLKKLYEVYLSYVGLEGNVALAEDMKCRVLRLLKEKYLDRVQEVMSKYFMNFPSAFTNIDTLENMCPYATLALSKYIRITTNRSIF